MEEFSELEHTVESLLLLALALRARESRLAPRIKEKLNK